jgi:GTP-binding protein
VNERAAGVNARDAGNAEAEGAAAALPLVAIIGRANVGKSTLFNRLVRQRRALVEDRPGVTRDRVAAPARIEGHEALVVDTGGLDPDAEIGIPAAVAAQVRRAVAEAAVILFVVDVRDGLLPLDSHIAGLLRRADRQVIVVVNKVDGPRQEQAAAEFHALGFSELIPVSAEHKLGLVDLELAIAERLEVRPRQPAPREEAAVRVAVIGRPNVGKSSLVNQLAGETQTIVSEQPGTTRDAIDLRLEVDGADVVLIDTAGLRRPGRREDRLERGSAFMALRSIERADVAILLVDAVEGVTEQDAKIARLALDRGRPLVIGLNKWDAVDPETREAEIRRELDRRLRFVPDARVVAISAKTGAGTRRLLREALQLFEEGRRTIPTSEMNRALREAVERNQPPAVGRQRLRFYYATQVADRPLTILIFTNNPQQIPQNYRRYLESFFRKRFGVRSAPVRVRFRARDRRDPSDDVGSPGTSASRG